jgi:hypothetical protein
MPISNQSKSSSSHPAQNGPTSSSPATLSFVDRVLQGRTADTVRRLFGGVFASKRADSPLSHPQSSSSESSTQHDQVDDSEVDDFSSSTKSTKIESDSNDDGFT